MNDEPNDRSPWTRPESDDDSASSSTPPPLETSVDSVSIDEQPTSPRRSARRWFGPISAVTVVVTAGFGFAVGRVTESADAEPAGAATTTVPAVTINGVTPPTPAPVGTNDLGSDTSEPEVLGVLDIDPRVIGPTRLVVTALPGLVEIDLATGEMRLLAPTKPGNSIVVVAGDRWAVATDGSRLVAQQDGTTELAELSRLPGQQVAWSPTASLGWISEPAGSAGQSTSWRQTTLDGETVTSIEVPDAAVVIGAVEEGIVGEYRGSTYVFNAAGVARVEDGPPIATNGTSIVLLRCERSTQCDLVVTDPQSGERSSTAVSGTPWVAPFYLPDSYSLSPDATKLLAQSIDFQDSGIIEVAGLTVVDLVTGAAQPIDLVGDMEPGMPLGWTSDSRHLIANAGGKLVAVDVTTGEQFALAQWSFEQDTLDVYGLATRP